MAVQPMKAVSAVLVTGQVGPGEVAAAGIALGLILLVLAATGSIGWLARVIPQSVSAGLQLGLGISMAVLGLELMWRKPWLGLAALALLAALMLLPRFPAAPAMLAAAIAAGYAAGLVQSPADIAPAWSGLGAAVPSLAEVWRGIELLVLPQLPLTLSNAVIVTALVCRDLFPATAGRASERNLALSTGLANLALAPLGAMPMCHGAGGVQAQHRFGARTGLAPILLGGVLLLLGLGFAAQRRPAICADPLGRCRRAAADRRRRSCHLPPPVRRPALVLAGDCGGGGGNAGVQSCRRPARGLRRGNPSQGGAARHQQPATRSRLIQCRSAAADRPYGPRCAAARLELVACCDPVQQFASPSRHFSRLGSPQLRRARSRDNGGWGLAGAAAGGDDRNVGFGCGGPELPALRWPRRARPRPSLPRVCRCRTR